MKNTKRVTLIFIMLLLSFSIFSSIAYAAITPGVTGGRLIGNYVAQAKSNWCWAASAENAIIWEMSPTRTQWDAVKYIKSTLLYLYPDVYGSIADAATAAEYISGNTRDYTSTESSKSYNFLCEQIYNSNAVIAGAGYYTASSTRHATLIVGWQIINAQNRLTYHDSAYNTRYTCTYTQFCDGSYNGRRYDQTCYQI